MCASTRPMDTVIDQICRYALEETVQSVDDILCARVALLDTMGCALAATTYPACSKLLGPLIPGTVVPNGARVPGTAYVLDPVRAAFNFGAALRWFDYNDTWLAAEWGHPSDNVGAILPLADCLARGGLAERSTRQSRPVMREVLDASIRAYEIQGILALENSLNRRGFDHVLFVKIASAAACARLLGADEHQMVSAVSNAIVDNAPLRTYRHAPNTGSRKSWAAADAASRGLLFAVMAMSGEMGYPEALSAPTWGLEDVAFAGTKLSLPRPLGSFVMRNILFKVSYPAEFHAQTALEAAIILHPEVRSRWREVVRIQISTHESAIRIIDKRGPLRNPADRDHCIQYIVAVGLLKGTLNSADYEDGAAVDERVDWLRDRTDVVEHKPYSIDYLDPDKRSAASAITVWFQDGTKTDTVAVEYPLGHPRRREEALPALRYKFTRNVRGFLGESESHDLTETLWNDAGWIDWPVPRFVDQFVTSVEAPHTRMHSTRTIATKLATQETRNMAP